MGSGEAFGSIAGVGMGNGAIAQDGRPL